MRKRAKKVTLVLLTLFLVYEDQMKLKRSNQMKLKRSNGEKNYNEAKGEEQKMSARE